MCIIHNEQHNSYAIYIYIIVNAYICICVYYNLDLKLTNFQSVVGLPDDPHNFKPLHWFLETRTKHLTVFNRSITKQKRGQLQSKKFCYQACGVIYMVKEFNIVVYCM